MLTSTKPFSLNAAGGQGAGGEQPPLLAFRELQLRNAKRALRVVATFDLETYVTGVLAGEAATLKSAPALAAMAVVARTWALKSRGRHKSAGFDFCSLTHCQFFRPASEAGDSDAVIRAEAAAKTSGVILMYHGQLIDAYYGANCGGMTESSGDVWEDRRAPYLQSVSDPYCTGGTAASWLQSIPIADLSDVLREIPGVSFGGPLRDIVIADHDASGRARTLRLVGNTSTQVDANAFRYAVNRRLGWNTLKSNLYTVERRNNGLIFTGRGLGHGVGLCQSGAEQMGRMGISYEKILAHYFPGTHLGHSDEHDATRILSSEHFEIVFPPRQERWAAKALEVLEASRVKLGNRASLMPTRTRVRTWETTAEFIRVTRQPGWVAGSNDGHLIDLQPLDLLKHKGILESTLRHELTHLVVRRYRASQVPRWYEEGMVVFLTGEPVGNSNRVRDPRRSLDLSISEPRSESEMRAAYAEAAERVRDLARRRGEAGLWQALERPSGEDLKWFRNPK
ncbi:MAG: SpoIID/LytB domain-containing protein [Terriglobia bacterium]